MRDDEMARRRSIMIEEIEREYQETAVFTGRDAMSPLVRAVMAALPRHAFVPESAVDMAYVNNAMPIGHGQTISQPYMVAIMTDLLEVGPRHRVLEVGTGSAYQAAVLARLAMHVYSIETLPELAEQAERRLRGLGIDNVTVRLGDGWGGWPEEAPFDRIIVTAAPPSLPEALVAQLAPGGRMVLPIGPRGGFQRLAVYHKEADGSLHGRDTLPVAFVPMIRGPMIKGPPIEDT